MDLRYNYCLSAFKLNEPFDVVYNSHIDPNLPAPMSPIRMGFPLASRSANLVDRLVIVQQFLLGYVFRY